MNQHGKWLLDLCTDNQMYILNGRTLGNFNGKFTCPTLRRSSVVDYFLASRSLSNIVFSMYVHNINLFSDYCLMTMKLNICNDIFIDEDLPQNEVIAHCRYMPDKFLWSNDAKLRFQDAFDSPEVQNKLNDQQLPAVTKHEESLINKLSDLMITAGNKSLKRYSNKPKRKKY